MSTTMTIRLDPELKKRLARLAEVTHRTNSYLAAEAIRDFIELNEWQLQEINSALQEADEGDFATETEVKRTFRKWGADAD